MNKTVILYSTGCPKCNILKSKLSSAGIVYTENNNVEIMLSKGIDTVPVLEVDDKLLSFAEANDWIKNRGS